MAPRSVPFLLRRSPYAANSSLRPPRAASVAFAAKMMCSPRARSSFVRRSAAAVSVIAPAGRGRGARAAGHHGVVRHHRVARGHAWVPVLGALVAPVPLHAAKTTAAAAVRMMGRNFTGRFSCRLVARDRRPVSQDGRVARGNRLCMRADRGSGSDRTSCNFIPVQDLGLKTDPMILTVTRHTVIIEPCHPIAHTPSRTWPIWPTCRRGPSATTSPRGCCRRPVRSGPARTTRTAISPGCA